YRPGPRPRPARAARAPWTIGRNRPSDLKRAGLRSHGNDPARARVLRRESWRKVAPLLRGFKRRCDRVAGGLDFGCLLFAQFDDMIDESGVVELINRLAVEIDHAGARAAAGEADVGFARFAWAVHDAADDRKRHRRGDVLQAFFQDAHGLD